MTTEVKTKIRVRERHFREPKENVFVYTAEFFFEGQEHFVQARVDKIECPIEKFNLKEWKCSNVDSFPGETIKDFIVDQVKALSASQRTLAKYFFYV